MILVNIDYIPGKKFEVLGLVKGYSSAFGAMMKRYGEATTTLEAEAEKLGADAVVNIRYAPIESVAFVSGTAVKFV